MNSPSQIAVIIATYNAPEFLRLTLAGYERQTDQNFRIYIADDGSDESIATVIQEFRARSMIEIEHVWHEDRGYRRAECINRAIIRSCEPYILLTDQDCVPLPEMIATHRRLAREGTFVRGSRILLSETLTREVCARPLWHPTNQWRQWLKYRFEGKVNRIFPLWLPPHMSKPYQKLAGIRGCHFAFWRKDIVAVNGLDASYSGWGREDSDLAARLMHAGIRRMDLRGMPVLHLWHPEASRSRLDDNDAMLRQCLAKKRIRAIQGLAEL